MIKSHWSATRIWSSLCPSLLKLLSPLHGNKNPPPQFISGFKRFETASKWKKLTDQVEISITRNFESTFSACCFQLLSKTRIYIGSPSPLGILFTNFSTSKHHSDFTSSHRSLEMTSTIVRSLHYHTLISPAGTTLTIMSFSCLSRLITERLQIFTLKKRHLCGP